MGVSDQRHAPAALYPRGKSPRYPLDTRLVGPRAGLDAEARRKILCLCRGSDSILTELPLLLLFVIGTSKLKKQWDYITFVLFAFHQQEVCKEKLNISTSPFIHACGTVSAERI
jgi:hypothetical protein